MISSRLKNRSLQKKIDKLSKISSPRNTGRDLKISSVGILSTEGISKMIDLQDLAISKLYIRNPKIYSYRKYDRGQEVSYKHFSENDFNWRGEVINPSLQSFIEQPFDMLICFYEDNNLFLEYVAHESKANLKVGFAEVHQKLFDIELLVNELQEELFFTELYKYLNILGKV